MKILWICFGGHHKIGLYLGVISMHFEGLFLRSMYRMRDIFGGCKSSKYFLGVYEIPDIFFG